MNDSNDSLNISVVDRLDWPRHLPEEYPILVCVQFDETGHQALMHAFRLAKTHGRAPLHIAHIVSHPSASGTSGAVSRNSHNLEEAEKSLRDFVAARLLGDSVSVKLHVRMGDVVQTALQLALDYDTEIIVVGTHGRKGVRKLALGSIAQKFVEEARCPVLIATSRDFSGMNPTLVPDPPRQAP